MGEAVGTIAAQSIGEPGTQLTLRTFHVGGTAGNISTENSLKAKYDGIIEFEELRSVEYTQDNGQKCDVVVGRLTELRIIDKNTNIILITHNIPYGAKLFVKDGQEIKKNDLLCEWDPFNALIITEFSGKIGSENLIEGETYKEESDETTGFREKVITEFRDKTKAPALTIEDKNGNIVKSYNLPVGAHIVVKEGDEVTAGSTIVKIPRAVGKAGDITGGLPRVTELFEARNPSNPAVVSEIDGEVTYGKIKRGNREIIVTSKAGEVKKYLVSLSKQILVQENDYVRAGTPLSDGAITPTDILNIQGPIAVQEYIVNEVQDVYRMQGVKNQIVDKSEFMEENDEMFGKKVVLEPGDSDRVKAGQIISARTLRDINSQLKRRDLRVVEARDAVPATSAQVLQGITRAALQTSSFISAASFQETTKVLNEAAIYGKVDPLEGLKENVICGHLIPVGTGMKELRGLVVGSKEEMEKMQGNK